MSLQTQYDPKNIFAKILNGDIPSVKVYEDERTLSFMDVFPQSKGHTLVIPKVPACNLFDISADDLKDLIAKMQMIGRAVRDALAPDGIRIAQFNGEAGGQTVFHIHFHIIPVWDGVSERAHASGQMADLNELKGIAAQIQAKL